MSPSAGLNAAVAAELRAELGRQRMTQKMLAKASGIPYGTLRRYLDATRHIDIATLSVLCAALDLELQDVVSQAVARTAASGDE